MAKRNWSIQTATLLAIWAGVYCAIGFAAGRELPSKLESMARSAVSQQPPREMLQTVSDALQAKGLRLLNSTSMMFPTEADDVFVIELENPFDFLQNQGYLPDGAVVESVRGYVLFVDRRVETTGEEPLFYMTFLAKSADAPLPSVLLVAGDSVVGFDLSENRAVILSDDRRQGVSPQFGLGDVNRLGSCFLDFLGLSGFSDIDDLVGNFCQLTGQTREAYEIVVGLSACVDLTVLPSNLGCYLSLALLARFVGCGINDIVQCINNGPGQDPCISPIPLNSTVGNAWSANCASSHRSGSYARYFTFTLSSPASVQIDLQSSADTYVYLLQGTGSGGSIIAFDDDGGSGYNSRIQRSLAAGSYTVEATTYRSGVTGSFNISVAATATSSGCLNSIAHNSSINGSWTSACGSAHRSGSYAKYYTFSLSSAASIQIDVQSSEDTYLYLLQGSGSGGSVLAYDDDGGNGLNSRLSGTAQPGTYTIEATTYSPARSGSFVVSLTVNTPSPSQCLTSIPFNTSVGGSWTSGCGSTHRPGSYARYYTFSLSATTTVRIDLASSSQDTFVYLLQGNGTNGSVVASDDDSGGNFNSRLIRTLGAGSYTIEATTFLSGRTGNFVVSVAR